MRLHAKKVSLFLLGCTLGVVGIGTYKQVFPWISSGIAQTDGNLALGACATQPSSEDDAILFISCGGIY